MEDSVLALCGPMACRKSSKISETSLALSMWEFERVGRIEHLEALLADLRTRSCECERMDSSSRATQLGALTSDEAVEVERLVIVQNELVDAVASLRRQLGEW